MAPEIEFCELDLLKHAELMQASVQLAPMASALLSLRPRGVF